METKNSPHHRTLKTPKAEVVELWLDVGPAKKNKGKRKSRRARVTVIRPNFFRPIQAQAFARTTSQWLWPKVGIWWQKVRLWSHGSQASPLLCANITPTVTVPPKNSKQMSGMGLCFFPLLASTCLLPKQHCWMPLFTTPLCLGTPLSYLFVCQAAACWRKTCIFGPSRPVFPKVQILWIE